MWISEPKNVLKRTTTRVHWYTARVVDRRAARIIYGKAARVIGWRTARVIDRHAARIIHWIAAFLGINRRATRVNRCVWSSHNWSRHNWSWHNWSWHNWSSGSCYWCTHIWLAWHYGTYIFLPYHSDLLLIKLHHSLCVQRPACLDTYLIRRNKSYERVLPAYYVNNPIKPFL